MTGAHGVGPVLHGYFRSTAADRIRIALNLKGIAYADAFHHLRKGEQRAGVSRQERRWRSTVRC